MTSGQQLRAAVIKGDEATVRALIEQGVDVNATDNYGYSPLLLAIQRNRPEIAKFLIEKGADIHGVNSNGFTTLDYAVTGRNVELVQMLLEKGFKMNKEKGKDLMLLDLVEGRFPEIEKLLRQYGGQNEGAGYTEDEIEDMRQRHENGETVLCKLCQKPLTIGSDIYCQRGCTSIHFTLNLYPEQE
jgi:ankyrin repeat protein